MKRLLIAVMLSVAPWSSDAPCADDPPLKEVLQGSDYLHYHRDIRFRMRGIEALEEGRFDDAMVAFRKAARYADKPSQAMVAELLWKGDGVARDRAAAYAWMDLAAERGHTPWVAFRETYWAELDASERRRALDVGKALYAEFGDAVAKKRLEHQLRKRRAKFTGSRVGMVRSMKIYMPINGMWSLVPETKVYDRRFWHADHYWEWQDEIWDDLPEGIVTVRDVEAVDEAVDKAGTRGEGAREGVEERAEDAVEDGADGGAER